MARRARAHARRSAAGDAERADGRAAPLPARADVPPARAGPGRHADRRAARRPPVGARRHRARRRRSRRAGRSCAGADAPPPRFAIIGYGKLGGKELGYASDLDLVFLYDDRRTTRRRRARARYTRLAQRLNTWLTSTTPAGPLYDTDLRLRPDGAKGLLASSLRGVPRATSASRRGRGSTRRSRARASSPATPTIGAAFEAERDAILRAAARSRDARRATSSTCGSEMLAGHPEPDRALRPQARPGRHGRHRVRRAVPGARARARASRRSRATPATSRCSAWRATSASCPPTLARDVADAYREYRRAAAQDAPDRRAARARRPGRRRRRAARRRGRAVDARVRRALGADARAVAIG